MISPDEEIEALRKENEYLRKQNATMTLMTHEVFGEVIEHLRLSEPAQTRRKPRCSKCGLSGHNISTCPLWQDEEWIDPLYQTDEEFLAGTRPRRSNRVRALMGLEPV